MEQLTIIELALILPLIQTITRAEPSKLLVKCPNFHVLKRCAVNGTRE